MSDAIKLEGLVDYEDALRIGLAVGPAGNVLLDFGKEIRWIGLPPAIARELAAKLLELADKAESS